MNYEEMVTLISLINECVKSGTLGTVEASQHVRILLSMILPEYKKNKEE